MRRCGWSGHRRGAGDGSPGGEAFRSGLAIGFGGETVAAWAKVAGDRAVGGEEALGVARTLEPSHPPLALPGRLCEFSARLLSRLCCRCSTLGRTSRLAAP